MLTSLSVMVTARYHGNHKTNYDYTKTAHFIEVLSMESFSGCQFLCNMVPKILQKAVLGGEVSLRHHF